MYNSIVFCKSAFAKMKSSVNQNPQNECGGLIFGRIKKKAAKVFEVSEAGPNAIQTSKSISFDMDYQLEVTKIMKERDFYVLGTWHSHPRNTSIAPSVIDCKTMVDISENFNGILTPIFCICGLQMNKFVISLNRVCSGEIMEISERVIEFEECE